MIREPLFYAKQAIETMMRKFDATELPPKGRFHYHQGVFLSGVYNTYLMCKDERYFDYMKEWIDSCINEDGTIKDANMGQFDDMMPGILLFPLYKRTGDEKYKKTLDILMDAIDVYPKTPEGGYYHKAWCENEMWLDGLYMEGPLRAQYGAEYGKPEYFDEVIFQALMMQEKTKDPKTGLMYHAWSYDRIVEWANKETGCSPEFWGRAMGWVPVALLNEMDFIPEGTKDLDKLKEMVVNLINSLIKFQSKDGRWYQLVDKVDDPKNWPENSCTCLYSAAIAKAFRVGLLPKEYLEYAKKGFEGVINSLTYEGDDLLLGNVCIGTGVGDYTHYVNRPTSTNDLHGMGAFLIMCTELANVM